MNCVFGHLSAQSSARCRLLALSFPPMTTIAPHSEASFTASSCLMDVAKHIVSKISVFVHHFFINFSHSSRLFFVWVVCTTTVSSFLLFSTFWLIQLSSSSAFATTTGSLHLPQMAWTSGWPFVPITSTCRPRSDASFTIRCILATFGHVASNISAPDDLSSSSTFCETPCDLIITRSPSAAFSGPSMTDNPIAPSFRTTSSLCMSGPRLLHGPSASSFSASSTDLDTPKQKPALFASLIIRSYRPSARISAP